jgi:predicted transcriptional regulator
VISEEQNQLALFAKAMSHPVRIYILQLLAGQNCCYSGDLAEVLPIARSTLSQHLKALKDAGLIQGEINPPKIKYCIHQENWDKAKALFSGLFHEKVIEKESFCK